MALEMLTSNQYWRGINRRFDRRAKRLTGLGFTYRVMTRGNVATDDERDSLHEITRKRACFAIFVRRDRRDSFIPAASLSNCDKRAWAELLGRNLRRGY